MRRDVWESAVDHLVHAHPEIRMDLAHARVAVIELVTDAGDPVAYLQVKADAERTAWFRAHRRETEAYILQALLGVGIELEAVAFVERFV
jgi:hypothetical protein